MPHLCLSQVSFGYGHGMVLRGVDLTIEAGERVALLGPNGSGKTTLLKLAAGVLRPTAGQVLLDGQSLSGMARRAVARQVAVAPQHFEMPFAFTVGEVVSLGRTPYAGFLTSERAADAAAVAQAMAQAGVTALAQRPFSELSGGERQKVVLALALAQKPELLLLDEPTQHLDLHHQMEMLTLVRQLNQSQGVTVLSALHDLNVAALYFDRLVLLHNGEVVADGPPAAVLTEAVVRRVYGAMVRVMVHPDLARPQIVLRPDLGEGS